MRFEAEIITEEVLPAIRSVVASRLHSNYGLNQREIADKLEITQPAVSQYMNGTRASKEVKQKIKEDPQIDIILEDTVDKIAKNEEYAAEISQIVRAIKDKGLLKEHFNNARKL